VIAPAGYETVSRVAPGLYQGAEPPHGQILRRAGFSMVVLCASENQPPDDAFPGIVVVRVSGLKDDGTEKNPRDAYRRAAPAAARVAAHRGRVLVTCHWGFNRSGLVTAIALCQRGYSPDLAVAMVRRARRPHGLSNPVYVQAILGGGR
jgi:hypothetical protein